MPVFVTPVTSVTVTICKLFFLVNFVFNTEYVAPIATRKSIILFPTVNCTWGSHREIVMCWEMPNGAPGLPHLSSDCPLLFTISWQGFSFLSSLLNFLHIFLRWPSSLQWAHWLMPIGPLLPTSGSWFFLWPPQLASKNTVACFVFLSSWAL